MMEVLLLLILTITCLGSSYNKSQIILYEDLGCVPVYEKNSPVRYNCPGLQPWKKECHFRGQIYKNNEIIPDKLSAPDCYTACFCKAFGIRSRFICAVLDCFEDTALNGFSDDIKCIFDGIEYKVGEKFFPKNSCLKCVCQKELTKKLEEPFCKQTTCAEQLKNSIHLQDRCAPLYSNRTFCCPDKWICHDGSEVVQGEPKSEYMCTFGSITLKIGQFFEKVYHQKAVLCICVVPPLLTCNEMWK